MLAVALVLSGCAELPLPQDKNGPSSDQATGGTGSQAEVVLNVASTPTSQPTLDPTAVPEPTATPILDEAPACGETAGQLADGYFPSQVIGRPVYYRIYLPPCYDVSDSEERYPAIYLFHGSPLDETHWINIGAIDAANRLIGSGELPPFIIVLPRGDLDGTFGHSSGGDNSWEGVVVNELIPYIDANYRTKAERDYRAIGGVSRGGVWSLEIAFRHPDMFASVGGHSPALSANLSPAVYDPLVISRDAPIDSLRIYLDAGDNDWTRFSTGELSQILDDRHLPHTFNISPGVHEDSYWSTQVEAYLKFYAAPWKAEEELARQLTPTP
jgi:enterochelin esterase-like enzyme